MMETMSEAMERLGAAGFEDDLVADGTSLRVAGTDRRHDPGDLAVVETVRFEGPATPTTRR